MPHDFRNNLRVAVGLAAAMCALACLPACGQVAADPIAPATEMASVGSKTLSEVARFSVEAGLLTVRSPIMETEGDSVVKLEEMPGFTVVGVDRAAGDAVGDPLASLPNSFKLVNHAYGRAGKLVQITQLFALPSHLQIARDSEDLLAATSVSLIQQSGLMVDPADGPPDPPVRMFVRSYRNRDGEPLADLSLTAATVGDLRRDHPTEFAKWVLPILIDFDIASLGTDDPSAAWQVLSADLKADPAVSAQVKVILADLDSPQFGTRLKAQESLAALGQAAVVVLAGLDSAGWSAEQRSSVDAFLVSRWPVSPEKAAALATNPDFLVDVLYQRDGELIALSLARLSTLAGRPLSLELPEKPAERTKAVESFRSAIRFGAATQPSTRQAP